MSTIKSIVCTTANQLVKEGYNKSDAFVEAWARVKEENGQTPKSEKSISDMELTEKVRKFKEIQAAIEELEAQVNEIKESIINEMETKQAEEIKVDVYRIRYITVVSNRFNTTEFKKEYNNLYNQYLKESVYKRFTVA